MSRLVPGIFGHEFNPPTNPLFGIGSGQMRSSDNVHNGGWYNKAGEKLGFGDLSVDDLIRIKDELQEGEAFIVLGESDSFWRFVEDIGPIGSMCKTTPTVNAPGIDYVLGRAMYVIVPGRVLMPLSGARWRNESEGKTESFRQMQRRYAYRDENYDGPTLDIECFDRDELPTLLGVEANIAEE